MVIQKFRCVIFDLFSRGFMKDHINCKEGRYLDNLPPVTQDSKKARKKGHQYRETVAELVKKLSFRVEKCTAASGGYGGDLFQMR